MKNHEKTNLEPWITMKTDLEPWKPNLEPWKTMKTDLEVEVEVDLRHLGKVIIFRDKQTDRTFLLYIDDRRWRCEKKSDNNMKDIVHIFCIPSMWSTPKTIRAPHCLHSTHSKASGSGKLTTSIVLTHSKFLIFSSRFLSSTAKACEGLKSFKEI